MVDPSLFFSRVKGPIIWGMIPSDMVGSDKVYYFLRFQEKGIKKAKKLVNLSYL